MTDCKNLIFIAAHNNQEKTLPYGIQSWKYYCQKYNIDFIVSNKTITSNFKTGGYCAYEKWNEEEIINSNYSKILIVDSDVIVRWDTPNVFEVFNNIEFGMVKDCGGYLSGTYHLDQWKDIVDISNIDASTYCNSGFLLLTLKNYKIINYQIKKYFKYWEDQFIQKGTNPDAIDQTPVNIIAWTELGGINLLPREWNNMVMCKYEDISFLNDSYIWHFTGSRLGGWKNKGQVMTEVWNFIKDNY